MQSDVAHLTLQDQLLTWFEKNKRQLLIGSIAVAVIGTVAGIYVWRQNQTQVDASEALSKIASTAYTGGPQAGTTEAFLKVAADYAGTDAAKRAVLMAAGATLPPSRFGGRSRRHRRHRRHFPCVRSGCLAPEGLRRPEP